MPETAFIVRVPEAEACVDALRERFDASVQLGVPAHITVLVPFMSPDLVSDTVLQDAQDALSQVPSFAFSLERVARFQATPSWRQSPRNLSSNSPGRSSAGFPSSRPFVVNMNPSSRTSRSPTATRPRLNAPPSNWRVCFGSMAESEVFVRPLHCWRTLLVAGRKCTSLRFLAASRRTPKRIVTLAELQRYLHDHIPLSRAMQVPFPFLAEGRAPMTTHD